MEGLVVLAKILSEVTLHTVPGDKFSTADTKITLRPASCRLFIERLPK
jgi:hypothetical protein